MKIFNIDEELIGIGEQTRGNLLSLDSTINTFFLSKVKDLA